MKTSANILTILSAAACFCLASAGCHHSAPSVMAPTANEIEEFDSAVRDGDTTIVSRLISAKPELINAKDTSGQTPVAIANSKNDNDMAALLKRHGGHE